MQLCKLVFLINIIFAPSNNHSVIYSPHTIMWITWKTTSNRWLFAINLRYYPTTIPQVISLLIISRSYIMKYYQYWGRLFRYYYCL